MCVHTNTLLRVPVCRIWNCCVWACMVNFVKSIPVPTHRFFFFNYFLVQLLSSFQATNFIDPLFFLCTCYFFPSCAQVLCAILLSDIKLSSCCRTTQLTHQPEIWPTMYSQNMHWQKEIEGALYPFKHINLLNCYFQLRLCNPSLSRCICVSLFTKYVLELISRNQTSDQLSAIAASTMDVVVLYFWIHLCHSKRSGPNFSFL